MLGRRHDIITLRGTPLRSNIIGCLPTICRKFYNVYELHREAYINSDDWTCTNDNAIQWFNRIKPRNCLQVGVNVLK